MFIIAATEGTHTGDLLRHGKAGEGPLWP